MKNLKSTYFVLPLLAANLISPPSFAKLTDGSGSKGGCNIESQMGLAASRGQAIKAVCDFKSDTKITVGRDKVSLNGSLVVEQRKEKISPKANVEKFELFGEGSNGSGNKLGPDAKAEAKQEPQEQTVYVATLTFSSDGDVAADPVTRTFTRADISNAAEIVNIMKSEYTKSIARVQKDVKDQEAKEKRQALIEEGEKNCVNDSDGKIYKADEKMRCQVSKVSDMSSKDARSYYNSKMKTNLESLVFRGDNEDRETAQGILESLSDVAALKTSANALKRSIYYQDKIEMIAGKIQMAGDNATEKGAAQLELTGLKLQMKSDREMMPTVSSMSVIGQGGRYNIDSMQAANDAQRYQSLLDNNMKMAFMTPEKFFQTMQNGSTTGIPSTNVDPMNRLGPNGNPMMNNQFPQRQQGPMPMVRQGVPMQNQYAMQGQRPYQMPGQAPYQQPYQYQYQQPQPSYQYVPSSISQQPVIRTSTRTMGAW